MPRFRFFHSRSNVRGLKKRRQCFANLLGTQSKKKYMAYFMKPLEKKFCIHCIASFVCMPLTSYNLGSVSINIHVPFGLDNSLDFGIWMFENRLRQKISRATSWCPAFISDCCYSNCTISCLLSSCSRKRWNLGDYRYYISPAILPVFTIWG